MPPFGAEHVRLLLGHPDEDDLVGTGESGQVLVHDVVLALPLGEADHRDVVRGGIASDVGDELAGHRGNESGRGDGEAPVPHEVAGHLTGALQLGDVDVEVHPVDALDLEQHVLAQHLSDRAR